MPQVDRRFRTCTVEAAQIVWLSILGVAEQPQPQPRDEGRDREDQIKSGEESRVRADLFGGLVSGALLLGERRGEGESGRDKAGQGQAGRVRGEARQGGSIRCESIWSDPGRGVWCDCGSSFCARHELHMRIWRRVALWRRDLGGICCDASWWFSANGERNGRGESTTTGRETLVRLVMMQATLGQLAADQTQADGLGGIDRSQTGRSVLGWRDCRAF